MGTYDDKTTKDPPVVQRLLDWSKHCGNAAVDPRTLLRAIFVGQSLSLLFHEFQLQTGIYYPWAIKDVDIARLETFISEAFRKWDSAASDWN